MRMEYRFRGYDVTGQKGWVYGDLTHSKRILQEKPFLADRMMVGGYEVYPESVGLASGIKDMNGREIFVGDIVRIHDSEFDEIVDSEVIFSCGVVGILNTDFGVPTSLSFFLDFHDGVQESYSDCSEYTVEVVSNVYEDSLIENRYGFNRQGD